MPSFTGGAPLRRLAFSGAIFCLTLGNPAGHAQSSLPVFPGAQGFGVYTPAGRGGTVHRVTNLNDTGTGSLRAALEATGPRVVIFEVSGTITWPTIVRISSGQLTVAGQTAPSPGVTIRGNSLRIEASDVLIQHLRFRTGDTPQFDPPPISVFVYNGKNILLDHLSIAWSIHSPLSFAAPSGNSVSDATVSNSIIAEALSNSYHPYGEHSRGQVIFQRTRRIASLKNLYAGVNQRNPVHKQDTYAVTVNTLNHYTGTHQRGALFLVQAVDETAAPLFATLIGNVGRAPYATSSWKPIYITGPLPTTSRVYVEDNYGPGYSANDPWSVVNNEVGTAIRTTTRPVWDNSIVPMPHSQVFDYVLANAGARPIDRDAVDTRLISDVRNGKGRIIDSQNDVGGWPALPMNKRTLTLPNDPNGLHSSGYTNLEVWLHEFAAAIEGRSTPALTKAPQPPSNVHVLQ